MDCLTSCICLKEAMPKITLWPSTRRMAAIKKSAGSLRRLSNRFLSDPLLGSRFLDRLRFARPLRRWCSSGSIRSNSGNRFSGLHRLLRDCRLRDRLLGFLLPTTEIGSTAAALLDFVVLFTHNDFPTLKRTRRAVNSELPSPSRFCEMLPPFIRHSADAASLNQIACPLIDHFPDLTQRQLRKCQRPRTLQLVGPLTRHRHQ